MGTGGREGQDTATATTITTMEEEPRFRALPTMAGGITAEPTGQDGFGWYSSAVNLPAGQATAWGWMAAESGWIMVAGLISRWMAAGVVAGTAEAGMAEVRTVVAGTAPVTTTAEEGMSPALLVTLGRTIGPVRRA